MELMTLPEVAEYLRMPLATVRYWRHTGDGPKTFKLGGKVVAKREDIDAWVQAAYDAGESPEAV